MYLSVGRSLEERVLGDQLETFLDMQLGHHVTRDIGARLGVFDSSYQSVCGL